MAVISAFIFDLDGVITDTAEYHFLAWKRLADEEGIPFTREDNEQLRGVSRRESLNRLLKGRPISEADAEAWMARKNSYYIAMLEEMTPDDILPGAREFLDNAQASNIKLAIGSASKNAHTVLDKLGITDRFDAVGDGHVVINTKPAPDLFVWVAGALRCPVEEAVVFEDAEAGVEAALAAGFHAVGIGGERVRRAHLQSEGLHALTVDQVLQRFSQKMSRR
ncbi:MAG: beta-phosphoglucomutase [Chloroflexota bacterium]